MFCVISSGFYKQGNFIAAINAFTAAIVLNGTDPSYPFHYSDCSIAKQPLLNGEKSAVGIYCWVEPEDWSVSCQSRFHLNCRSTFHLHKHCERFTGEIKSALLSLRIASGVLLESLLNLFRTLVSNLHA